MNPTLDFHLTLAPGLVLPVDYKASEKCSHGFSISLPSNQYTQSERVLQTRRYLNTTLFLAMIIYIQVNTPTSKL